MTLHSLIQSTSTITVFLFYYKGLFCFDDRLIDPQTQVTRISVSITKYLVSRVSCFIYLFYSNSPVATLGISQFQLGEVCQFVAHQENGRLMGFVVESKDWSDGDEEGESSFSAFIFESNTEGEKVHTTNTSVLFKERKRVE